MVSVSYLAGWALRFRVRTEKESVLGMKTWIFGILLLGAQSRLAGVIGVSHSLLLLVGSAQHGRNSLRVCYSLFNLDSFGAWVGVGWFSES